MDDVKSLLKAPMDQNNDPDRSEVWSLDRDLIQLSSK
jgi:hypothetical protein